MKKRYVKPSMKVYELPHRSMILSGSPGSDPNWWNQPGGPGQF